MLVIVQPRMQIFHIVLVNLFVINFNYFIAEYGTDVDWLEHNNMPTNTSDHSDSPGAIESVYVYLMLKF